MKPHKKKRMRSLNILSLILLPLASKGCPFLRSQGHTERMLQSDYITELLDNHQDVDRSVSKNADGSITTVTTSTRDEVGGWLQDHVATMKARLERGGTPRPWDPFFVALSDHHDEFDATISNVNNPRGVKVDMRASTMCGQDLIDGHTAVVSKFVSTGRVEAQKSHDAPASCGSSSSGSGGGGGGISCFSGDSQAIVRDHGLTSVQELRVGDYVMTNEEGTYQPIYAFAHFNPDHIATFLQIHHSSGNKPLEVTSEHLLFLKGQAEPVTAAEVRIGDELRLLGRNASSTILHITEVERAGIFAPLTKEGTIVVDGAVASNYASLIGEEKNPSARSLIREVLDEHTYCHLGLAPFRLLCAFAPSLCDSYDTDGMPYYISAGIWLTRFATLKCPMIIQWLFLVIFLVVTYACILVERLSGSFLVYLIGASVGVLFLARRQQEKVA